MRTQSGPFLLADSLHGVRSIAFVVLDSLRWDSFERARKPVLDRRAPLQEMRFSYASWTQPSHACLLAGLLPHRSQPGALAVSTYASDQSLWAHVLGGGEEAKRHLFPTFSLPVMARLCGWRTIGRVAMPILNEDTPFSRGFDDYSLAPSGANLGAQIESVTLSLDPERNFVFINAGETHYPYLLPKSRMPRISGICGALGPNGGTADTPAEGLDRIPFSAAELAAMHASQVQAVELADRYLERLLEILPKPIFFLVVSDHGELFGEDGYFGHGPFFHRLLFEVPLAAGVVR